MAGPYRPAPTKDESRLLQHGATGVAATFIENIMEFLKELYGFLMTRKKFWLLPIILTLLLFGVLIVLTSGSAVAPFIYTLF